MPTRKARQAALDRFTPRSAPDPAEEPSTRSEPSPPTKADPDPAPATPPAADHPTTDRPADMAATLADSLAVSTVADLLGITETALRVRISEGRFPSVRAGRMRVVPLADLKRWLADREQAAKAEAARLAEINRRASKAPRVLEDGERSS